jgi:2'-hydroxyisoflavone reductase
MSTDRRDFVKTSMAATVGLALGRGDGGLEAAPRAPAGSLSTVHPLRILILGGTSMLGPHSVAYALGRGHTVSIFTRGRTEPTVHKELFRHVEHLEGDRASDLTALEGRSWDAVIDNSGRSEEWTLASARLLEPSVETYLYTSSTGVYYPYVGTDMREDREVAMEVPAGSSEDVAYTSGVMKARSEQAAREIFGPDRTTVVRPTYMMGPADGTDRFTYWPVRIERGGEILVPGRGHDPVQYVDCRDVSEWMVRLIENRTPGTFNAAGPSSPQGMHEFVHGVRAAFSAAVSWVMIPDYDFLEEHGVSYAVPWIPPIGNNEGSARANLGRALANGLTFRPLAVSCRDLLDWWYSDAVPQDRRDRMISGERSLIAREAAVIAAWKARAGN